MTLPPYIKTRSRDDDINYQTYFAQKEGAVASPTAGLHFTKKIIDDLKKKNVHILPITLQVGAGT
jgi:S-adenosylmethionine:tRNA-ribosyltransferase-isomerase (queuine synthetase)